MVWNERSSFLPHVKNIDVKSPFSYHIQLWPFFEKFSIILFSIMWDFETIFLFLISFKNQLYDQFLKIQALYCHLYFDAKLCKNVLIS